MRADRGTRIFCYTAFKVLEGASDNWYNVLYELHDALHNEGWESCQGVDGFFQGTRYENDYHHLRPMISECPHNV